MARFKFWSLGAPTAWAVERSNAVALKYGLLTMRPAVGEAASVEIISLSPLIIVLLILAVLAGIGYTVTRFRAK